MTGGRDKGWQTSFTKGESSPDDPDLVCVEGVLERIVFESEDTGFFVGRLRERGKQELTTFVGSLVATNVGETIRLWGRWTEDPRFGPQLKMERYEVILPTSVRGIEKYLGSGLIPGIGKKYAKRLVESFGVETLRVISDEPERLRKVPGIGRKRAAGICESWGKQKAVRALMLFLQGHGVAMGQAVKIYKRYGDASVAVLRENPYRLAEDIAGIAFKSADKIAEQLGIAKDSPQRAEAGLLYVLDRSIASGHVFQTRKELLAATAELLEINAERLSEALPTLLKRDKVVEDGDSLYPQRLWEAETGAARLLKRLVGSPRDDVSIQVEKALKWVESTQKIELSKEQREAIRTAVDAKAMVITGGPGTGKTTVLNSLLAIFEYKKFDMLLAAPTGRAAKRMEQATGHEARTIHRLLEFSPKEGGFTRNETNPLDADLVVIDEASMMDITLVYSLLRALPPGARLFLVGDVDQLPSVGPGNVLLDVIASGLVPVVWLKTIFRQASESGIITNAHRINQGEYPEFNTTDFFFVERKDPERALETVIELVTQRIPKKFGYDPFRDIQVLAPMRRGEVGVTNLNETLKQALNAQAAPIGRRPFGLGDKVMQLSNNYELDVYNGDVGLITLIDTELQEVQIQFEDRAVLYTFDQLDELSLAYASTVHKAQGSEYPVVVMPLLTQHFMMLQRNILYTAITRAAKLVIIVGDPKALRLAINNTRVTQRNTRLAERLKNVSY
jgi:exodeoxyribonuclease V alpha subunit